MVGHPQYMQSSGVMSSGQAMLPPTPSSQMSHQSPGLPTAGTLPQTPPGSHAGAQNYFLPSI